MAESNSSTSSPNSAQPNSVDEIADLGELVPVVPTNTLSPDSTNAATSKLSSPQPQQQPQLQQQLQLQADTSNFKLSPPSATGTATAPTSEDDNMDFDSDGDDDEDSKSNHSNSNFNQNSKTKKGEGKGDVKRSHHNVLERKRRDLIKDSFAKLRDAVPTLSNERASRAQILKKAADFIQFTQQKNEDSRASIDELIKKNAELAASKKVKTLKYPDIES